LRQCPPRSCLRQVTALADQFVPSSTYNVGLREWLDVRFWPQAAVRRQAFAASAIAAEGSPTLTSSVGPKPFE
jgi:hypothetical protein